MLLPPRLVIFDCDGVLVDSEPTSCRVLAESLERLGLPMSVDEVTRVFRGRDVRSGVRIIEERLGRPIPPAFLEDHKQRAFEALEREVEPVDGIENALDALAIPFCVATSGVRAKALLTLGKTGLLGRFEGRLFTAEEVERGKPAPDLFLHTAERMGVSPDACVVVEDSVPGVEAGRAAGMRVLGYAAQTPAPLLRAAGAEVFLDMRELPRLLDGGDPRPRDGGERGVR